MSLVFDHPAEGRAALVRKGQYVVLRVSGSSRYINRDYAPSHHLSEADPELRGADAVFNWVVKEKPTGEDRELARQYLQQWPEGPQAETAEALPTPELPLPVVSATSMQPPESTPASDLFDRINRMVWELGDHETDSARALQLRSEIHAALSLLRSTWRKRDRSGN